MSIHGGVRAWRCCLFTGRPWAATRRLLSCDCVVWRPVRRWPGNATAVYRIMSIHACPWLSLKFKLVFEIFKAFLSIILYFFPRNMFCCRGNEEGPG